MYNQTSISLNHLSRNFNSLSANGLKLGGSKRQIAHFNIVLYKVRINLSTILILRVKQLKYLNQ